MALGFWNFAEQDPKALALVTPDEKLVSRGELAAASNRLARGLRAPGLAPGDSVAVVLENGQRLHRAVPRLLPGGPLPRPHQQPPRRPRDRLHRRELGGEGVRDESALPRGRREGAAGAEGAREPPLLRRRAARLPSLRRALRRPERRRAREPQRRRGDELHLGHHRPPEGRAPPALRHGPRPDRRPVHRLPADVRREARGRERPHHRLAALPHRGADVRVGRACTWATPSC